MSSAKLGERVDFNSPFVQVSHRWRAAVGVSRKNAMFTTVSALLAKSFAAADSSGEATITLSNGEFPAAQRAKAAMLLLQIEIFAPFHKVRPAAGAGGWAMAAAGVRSALISTVYWEKPGMATLHVVFSPLALAMRSQLGAQTNLAEFLLPGKYTRKLYTLVASQELPLELSVAELQQKLLGSKPPPSLLIRSNFWNMVLHPAISMVRRFTSLPLTAERVMGTEDGHHAMVGVRFLEGPFVSSRATAK